MTALNGATASADSQETFARIEHALQVSYDPKTSADVRQEALAYLEELMNNHEAPHHGFTLANNHSLPAHARHFGLSLLEIALVRKWDQYASQEIDALRQWVVELARSLRPEDAGYIRNKIALLWVELAKRTWGDTWMDMDTMLLQLWDVAPSDARFLCNKVFVLYVLECLSDDICVRENPVAMLRQETLGHALNEAVIPPQLYRKYKEGEDDSTRVRQSEAGWLLQTCNLLRSMAGNQANLDTSTVTAIITRALESLKPTVSWISFDGIIETECIDCVYDTLAYGNETIRVAAIELLLAIFSRPYNPHFHTAWEKIFRSAITPTRIEMMKRTFTASETNPDDIDETSYTLQKKLSEVLAAIGAGVSKYPSLFESDTQIMAFYDLSANVFQSDSLLVSIPVLHSLSDAIATKHKDIRSLLQQADSILMDTCLVRLIKFEALPQDTSHPILKYLHEDFETLPELHAFLGNYRRYCTKVIERISQERPVEAISYLLQQMKDMFGTVDGLRGSRTNAGQGPYSKNDIPIVQLEANYLAVKSALSGYSRWANGKRQSQLPGQPDPTLRQEIAHSIEQFSDQCNSLMQIGLRTSDPAAYEHLQPDVARVCSKMLIEIVLRLQPAPDNLVVSAAAAVLRAGTKTDAADAGYLEAMKQFEIERLAEIQRLAVYFPNQLYDNNQQIFALIERLLEDTGLDDKSRWGYKALPVTLTQRTVQLDEQSRLAQLQPLLEPIAINWSDESLAQGASSFEGFCEVIGLSKLTNYVEQAKFGETADWANTPLDDAGTYIQKLINQKLESLPLRMTTSLLGASSEGLKENSAPQRIAAAIWGKIIPIILPNLLTLLRHATSFAAPQHWEQYPTQIQSVVRKMLVDRFWQSGISSESRDDFAARVSGSSKTYEGFASTVRGAPRQVRDSCYYIIHGMTRFPDVFYGITDLAEPLATALLGDAEYLSTHHLQRLISLLDRLVERCPSHNRQIFLSPLISLAFSKLRIKLTKEWELVEASRSTDTDTTHNLSEEMKADSIVRSTTYTVINFAHKLLVPSQIPRPSSATPDTLLSTLLLSSPTTTEPLVAFLTDALRMRDSRCVAIATHVLRSVVAQYTALVQPGQDKPQPSDEQRHTGSTVQAHLETTCLQAAITSLNESYFVDVQKDLSALIACVVHNYAPCSGRAVGFLLSIQGLDPGRVQNAVHRVVSSKKEREQRAIVMELLEGIRGVRMSEVGKIGVGGNRRDEKGKRRWVEGMDTGEGIVRGGTPPEGMGEMFGDQ
ncbi:hypothetical protein KVT40_007129 [Elsinoe batatas]|uniref:Importin N-terminal domain-containing protein n=1 Tax=Elsinoe batatas TaxID=2601811 RepID=A0A8K0PFK5_9PEZI|nr:hypothetical protein KVT40_007129 [Elsinoe batatas]